MHGPWAVQARGDYVSMALTGPLRFTQQAAV